MFLLCLWDLIESDVNFWDICVFQYSKIYVPITGRKGGGKRGKEKRNTYTHTHTHTHTYISIYWQGDILLLTTLFGDTWFILSTNRSLSELLDSPLNFLCYHFFVKHKLDHNSSLNSISALLLHPDVEATWLRKAPAYSFYLVISPSSFHLGHFPHLPCSTYFGLHFLLQSLPCPFPTHVFCIWWLLYFFPCFFFHCIISKSLWCLCQPAPHIQVWT